MFRTYNNLKNLHNLYEQNFILLSKISGQLEREDFFSFNFEVGKQSSLVEIKKIKLSKFTDELDFFIEDPINIKNISLKCRIYKEAKMIEVIEFQNFHKDLLLIFSKNKYGLQKDERIQWNLFMNQFLNYCIHHGLSIENYLSPRI
tara:strand:- start:328 stop:765 length:438 start_codon:yes stop_codon:yes gene_type:complete